MNKKKLFLPLSIKIYTVFFLILFASLAIGLSLFAIDKINNSRLSLIEQNKLAAHGELDQAINDIQQTFTKLTVDLSNWDELFQQLQSPAYYSYWRGVRLLHAGVLPSFIEAAEVFDKNGLALAVISDSQFEVNIKPDQLNALVEITDGNAYVVMYLPIRRNNDQQQPAEGFLGIRFPFITYLENSLQFFLIEKISLKKNITPSKIPLSSSHSLLKLKLKSNTEADSLLKIIQSTITQFALIVAIICLLFYFSIVYLLGKPLRQISIYIDQLRNQEINTTLDINFPIKELDKVKTSLNQYQQDLQIAQSHLDSKNNELWELAHHDSLTGVFNRRAFDLEWKKIQQVINNKRVGIALILFDINRFKAINDSYGHQIGDNVLTTISHSLKTALRKGEQLYRLGGDEFATIVIGGEATQSMALAERCVKHVNELDYSNIGIKEKISTSCGIAYCKGSEFDTIKSLQQQADIAVYQAKRPNGNNPILFQNDMIDGTEAVFSSWMSDAVYEAVLNGTGIEMHYQPIVDSKTGETKYFEALLRIRHEDTYIPPTHIFPIISLRQLETELDRQVITKVSIDLKNNYLPEGCGVSVNLSAESVSHRDIIKWMEPLTDFTQSHYIVIEVTETSLITQLKVASHSLNILRELGFKIALDDFGSGYSSLQYITNMPVDIIKFDITLIQGMLDNRLGKLVFEMAKLLIELDFNLVAEGIETDELRLKAFQAGFQYSQGFLFEKPIRKQLSHHYYKPI